MPDSAWVFVTVLTAAPVVQVCTGSWCPLSRFRMLSLLKPLVVGSEFGLSSGASSAS